eukprot:4266947-Pleurochrysis_carterae.AAC.1
MPLIFYSRQQKALKYYYRPFPQKFCLTAQDKVVETRDGCARSQLTFIRLLTVHAIYLVKFRRTTDGNGTDQFWRYGAWRSWRPLMMAAATWSGRRYRSERIAAQTSTFSSANSNACT